jgi:hypothetical protein
MGLETDVGDPDGPPFAGYPRRGRKHPTGGCGNRKLGPEDSHTESSGRRGTIMMSSDAIHTIRISKLIVSGLPEGPIERELRSRLEHAETNRAAAADLCKTLLTRTDLHSNTSRYWQLERAIAQLVRANMDIARALAELGDYLVDGTLHEQRP